MPKYDIYIGKATASERETQICRVCGRPCVVYGCIEDNTFYFCKEHEHLATEKNLIKEFERLNEE